MMSSEKYSVNFKLFKNLHFHPKKKILPALVFAKTVKGMSSSFLDSVIVTCVWACEQSWKHATHESVFSHRKNDETWWLFIPYFLHTHSNTSMHTQKTDLYYTFSIVRNSVQLPAGAFCSQSVCCCFMAAARKKIQWQITGSHETAHPYLTSSVRLSKCCFCECWI